MAVPLVMIWLSYWWFNELKLCFWPTTWLQEWVQAVRCVCVLCVGLCRDGSTLFDSNVSLITLEKCSLLLHCSLKLSTSSLNTSRRRLTSTLPPFSCSLNINSQPLRTSAGGAHMLGLTWTWIIANMLQKCEIRKENEGPAECRCARSSVIILQMNTVQSCMKKVAWTDKLPVRVQLAHKKHFVE